MRVGFPLLLVAAIGCHQSPATAPQQDPGIERLADLQGRDGQVLTLTGRFKSVIGSETDDDGQFEPNLVMNWSTGTQVTCSFPKALKQPDFFDTMETGQKITVRGKLAGTSPNHAYLEKCEYLGSPR